MKTTWKNFEIESEFSGSKASPWDPHSYDRHHIITVKNVDNDEEVSFDYWASKAHPEVDSEEELMQAFDCLFVDASFGFPTFEEFARENGYDIPDEFFNNWKACKKAKSSAIRLVGDFVDWEDVANDLREEING